MHMVELTLSPLALAQYARERGLTGQALAADPGYAVHCWLAEALDDGVVRPFTLVRTTPHLRVLGYSELDAGALQQRLARHTNPAVLAVSHRGPASKPMPDQFEAGAALGFEVTLQPTRKTVGNVEKDAFLVACEQRADDAPLTREAAYARYLQERLGAAAQLRTSALASFTLTQVVRKRTSSTGARPVSSVRVPRAVMRGVLQVRDPAQFAQLLRAGIGRGRGLGFGMLLLARA
jgi:CRISPR-associated protein Cas6/Cse3/CasE subtype I-E